MLQRQMKFEKNFSAIKTTGQTHLKKVSNLLMFMCREMTELS